MISKRAIEEFLNREVASFAWLKKQPRKELLKALKETDPSSPIDFNDLWTNQLVMVLLGLHMNEFLFLADMGCVDADTEYLSPQGWVKISQYQSGKVAQYNPHTGNAEFVYPAGYLVKPCSEMYHFKTARGLDQMLSADHRMLVLSYTRGASWRAKMIGSKTYPEYQLPNMWLLETTPRLLEEKWNGRTYGVSCETTFHLKHGRGIPLTDEQIRVQIAFQADGSFGYRDFSKLKRRWGVIRIKKERKKLRLRELLSKAGIEYTEKPAKPDGFVVFKFVPPLRQKDYSGIWWQATQHQREVICDEVMHWDGSSGHSGGKTFHTTKDCDSDFVQYCFVSIGRRARKITSKEKSKLGDNHSQVHTVGSGRTKTLVNYSSKAKIVPTQDGKMYCFSVPTGYLIFRRNGCVFVSGNTGKTKTCLRLIQYRKAQGEKNCWLVVVLNNVAIRDWEKQVREHAPDLSCVVLDKAKARHAQLEEEADLFLIHYPGLVACCAKLEEKKNEYGRERRIQRSLIERMQRKFTGIIIDEMSEIGKPRSVQSRTCRQIAEHMKYRYGLTGTPFGRDPLPLWNQFHIIDGGKTLGETQGLFREAFYKKDRNYWGGYEYTFKKKLEKDLHRLIAHRSITYTEGECQDLPKRVPIRREILLPDSMQGYYQNELKIIRKSEGGFRETKAAFLRMRQLASGFLAIKNDETGAKAEIEFPINPKLEDLMEVIKELPSDAKMIIFHDFIWTGERISQELKAHKYKHVRLYGGQKDQGDAYQTFLEDPSCRFITANNKLGSMSLNMQVAHYIYYFESPVRPILRIQGERRARRAGQKAKRVFIIDPIAITSDGHSVDQRILDWLHEGKNLLRAILQGKEKL